MAIPEELRFYQAAARLRLALRRQYVTYGHGDSGEDWCLSDYTGEGSKLVQEFDEAATEYLEMRPELKRAL